MPPHVSHDRAGGDDFPRATGLADGSLCVRLFPAAFDNPRLIASSPFSIDLSIQHRCRTYSLIPVHPQTPERKPTHRLGKIPSTGQPPRFPIHSVHQRIHRTDDSVGEELHEVVSLPRLYQIVEECNLRFPWPCECTCVVSEPVGGFRW